MKQKIRSKRIPVFSSGNGVLSDRQILAVKDLLRPDEAAKILRVSRSQVYEMAALGEIQATKRRPLRIKSASVTAYLDAC